MAASLNAHTYIYSHHVHNSRYPTTMCFFRQYPWAIHSDQLYWSYSLFILSTNVIRSHPLHKKRHSNLELPPYWAEMSLLMPTLRCHYIHVASSSNSAEIITKDPRSNPIQLIYILARILKELHMSGQTLTLITGEYKWRRRINNSRANERKQE